jgi:hypothetical protein
VLLKSHTLVLSDNLERYSLIWASNVEVSGRNSISILPYPTTDLHDYPLQEFFFLFFDDTSQRPAMSFEALAQDPPGDGFISRNNPAKKNLVIGERMDMCCSFQLK